MSKYITKEEYIQRIKRHEMCDIDYAKSQAEFIADRVTRIHPINNGIEGVFVADYFNSDKQLKMIENKLHELLPFLEFKFTPIEEGANGTKYRVRWALRKDLENEEK